MSLLQLYFTADAKFLTSFRTIAISIGTWCRPYIFFLFNFGTTSSLFSSFNRELKQRHSTHGSRKRDLIFFLICHETQISITNSLNRTLWPKIWASYYSAEYCPRMRKRTFGWRESGSKRLCSSSLLKCWIISSCRTLCLHLSFSLDFPNSRQGQGAWICGMPFTRVFIPPRFSSPFIAHFNIKRYNQINAQVLAM